MAIAFDAATNSTFTTGTNSFLHTCGGSNRILFVGTIDGTGAGSISNVTYAGVAMTNIYNYNFLFGSANLSLWYLINPASGSNTVSASGAGSINCALATSYTGVKQSGQPDAINFNNSSGSSVSTSVTTIADNCWIIALGEIKSDTSCTAGSGFTFRIQGNNSGGNNLQLGFEDTNGPIHPPGVTTTAMNFGASTDNTIAAVSFSPALSSSGNPSFILNMI